MVIIYCNLPLYGAVGLIRELGMVIAFHHDAEVSECAVVLFQLLASEDPFNAARAILCLFLQIGKGVFFRNAFQIDLGAVAAFVGSQLSFHAVTPEYLVQGNLTVNPDMSVVTQDYEDGLFISAGILCCLDYVSDHPVGKFHHFQDFRAV